MHPCIHARNFMQLRQSFGDFDFALQRAARAAAAVYSYRYYIIVAADQILTGFVINKGSGQLDPVDHPVDDQDQQVEKLFLGISVFRRQTAAAV